MSHIQNTLLRRKFITNEGIQNIKNHKYKGGVYTPIDNAMNHFWYYSVEFFPRTLAPNAITLIGLLFNLSSMFIILFYTTHLSGDVPNWVFIYFAITLFIYQTFDAVDGKQARRIGMSSPLGQLFDHGCDAVQSGMLSLIIIYILNIGENIFLIRSVLFSTIFIFYIANWAEYFTGVLITSNNGLGVTEIQFVLMFISVLTGIYGREIYNAEFFGIQANTIIIMFILIVSLISVIPVFREAYEKANDKKIYFKMLVPILLILISIFFVIDEKFNGYLVFCYFMICFSFVTNVVKIIVSSMSKMKFKMFHFECYFLLIVSLALRFLDLDQFTMILLLAFSTIIIIINFLSLSLSIIFQISQELNLKIITV
jgi:ethanolaminephosphotransferase